MATIADYTESVEKLEAGELTFAPHVWEAIDDYGEMEHESRVAYEANMIRREIERALWQPWAKREAQTLCLRLLRIEQDYRTKEGVG